MIRLQGVSKAYGAKILFDNINYLFPLKKRIALVGANGTGKTTLLNVLCQLEDFDKGEILRPRDLNFGYLPQEPNSNPAESIVKEALQGNGKLQDLLARLNRAEAKLSLSYCESNLSDFEAAETAFRYAGGLSLEARAKGILAGLGFAPEWFDRSPTDLSGGWRMRLELAKIFVNDPDFLILDEPTNHLDLPSLVWVEKYLKEFSGTLLFVSHDKSLLNRLSQVTLHLHGGRLAEYQGNFDSFLEQRESRLLEEESQREGLRKRRESLEVFVTRFGAQATKAKQAQSKAKMIVRIKDLEGSLPEDVGADSMSLTLPEAPPSGKQVLEIQNLSIGYAKVLSKNLNFNVYRAQRIAVIGANGIGKSTLLKTIVGTVEPLAGAVTLGHNVALTYFAQDQLDTLDIAKSVLQNVMYATSDISEKQARTLLGHFLFRGDDVFKPVGVLSGGEKSRVGLACLLARKANFLVLDEPTNHLDISSAAILADAISEFSGTAIFVSHDRDFIDAVCTHVFAMCADGRAAMFEGNLQDYERLSAVANFPNVLQGDSLTEMKRQDIKAPKSAHHSVQHNPDKKLRQKLERDLAKLETAMSTKSDAIAALELQLSLNSHDYQKLSEIQKLFDSQRAELRDLESQWIDITEQMETLA